MFLKQHFFININTVYCLVRQSPLQADSKLINLPPHAQEYEGEDDDKDGSH